MSISKSLASFHHSPFPLNFHTLKTRAERRKPKITNVTCSESKTCFPHSPHQVSIAFSPLLFISFNDTTIHTLDDNQHGGPSPFFSSDITLNLSSSWFTSKMYTGDDLFPPHPLPVPSFLLCSHGLLQQPLHQSGPQQKRDGILKVIGKTVCKDVGRL